MPVNSSFVKGIAVIYNNNNNNNAILKGDVSCDALQYLIFVSLEILLNTILKQL